MTEERDRCWADKDMGFDWSGDQRDAIPCSQPGIPPLYLCAEHAVEILPQKEAAC